MMTHESKITVLDCTLRDGGYYNDWDFSFDHAQEYIDCLHRAGVDVIEVGFRFTPKSKFLGPFAYTTEDSISKLVIPEEVTFGVMINASDYLSDDWEDKLENAFVERCDSKISLVRIAAHINQVMSCGKLVAWLKRAGYSVGLNIMQISQAEDAQIVEMVKSIEAQFVAFEALYFADSLGNLSNQDVRRIVGLFKTHTEKSIGFHGHDNIGLGVSNSIAAIEAGATWIDGTVTGMGRGAGNTQTEFLALELEAKKLHSFNMLDIQKAATGWLETLKTKCRWGTNIFYYEAGLRSVHPSYVQQMLSSQKYEAIDILVMIEALGTLPTPNSYQEANVELALTSLMQSETGSFDVTDQWSGRPVIFIANGPSCIRHIESVMSYASKINGVVIALNHNDYVSPRLIDGVACIHPARMMHLLDQKDWSSVPIYTSSNALPQNVAKRLSSSRVVRDYGVRVVSGSSPQIGASGCVISQPQVLQYAWSIAKRAGCAEILLAGLDGYDGRSPAFHETNNLLFLLQKDIDLPIYSLTKTHYNVPNIAVYSKRNVL